MLHFLFILCYILDIPKHKCKNKMVGIFLHIIFINCLFCYGGQKPVSRYVWKCYRFPSLVYSEKWYVGQVMEIDNEDGEYFVDFLENYRQNSEQIQLNWTNTGVCTKIVYIFEKIFSMFSKSVRPIFIDRSRLPIFAGGSDKT
jgi:hypothetical protein